MTDRADTGAGRRVRGDRPAGRGPRAAATVVTLGPGDDAAVVAAARRPRRWCPPTCWSRAGISAGLVHAARRRPQGDRAERRRHRGDGRAARPRSSSAFGAPGDTPAAQVVELADGMWHEAGLTRRGHRRRRHGEAPQWVISVTVLGDLGGRAAGPPRRRAGPVTRSRSSAISAGRRPDMRCCSTALSEFEALRRRHLVPEPPYGQGRGRRRCGCHGDDGRLRRPGGRSRAHRARVGCGHRSVVGRAGAPTATPLAAAAAAVAIDPWDWVLGGGEDHALVATFPGSPPAGLAGDRAGARRPAAGAGGRRAVERKHGLAVVLTDARTLGWLS